MSFSLEGEDGRPWTASTNVGWITLLTVLTAGIAAMLLSLYLSLWIRSKGRSVLPLISFLFVLFGSALMFILGNNFAIDNILDSLISIIWIFATFSLRHEIRQYYNESEGWEIDIRPIFTFLFSAVYINYCLNPVTLSEGTPMTSLNLRK